MSSVPYFPDAASAPFGFKPREPKRPKRNSLKARFWFTVAVIALNCRLFFERINKQAFARWIDLVSPPTPCKVERFEEEL